MPDQRLADAEHKIRRHPQTGADLGLRHALRPDAYKLQHAQRSVQGRSVAAGIPNPRFGRTV